MTAQTRRPPPKNQWKTNIPKTTNEKKDDFAFDVKPPRMEKDLLANLDLSFAPAWARQPSEKTEKWALSDANGRPKRPGRRDGGKANFSERGGFGRRAAESGQERRRRFAPDRQAAGPVVLPGLKISFIPERRGLKPLVKQISGTKRACSLFEVAATFLSKPEFYAVAIESNHASGAPTAACPAPNLYQCAECKAVFANKAMAVTHALSRHLDLFYEKEEKECEAPQGNFLCVARCTLSGVLLGPPNHHEFTEKLQELHRTRFAGMPLDEYRKKIVNETDPALIEQWKKASARKTVYRVKQSGEPLVFERGSELERHFISNYAPALVRTGNRFVLPATTAQDLDDRQIRTMIQDAWKKEVPFPINMALAIQKRFSRLGLYIFKTSARMSFVSGIKPHPLDPAQATETIRQILEWIGRNGGKTRQDLVAALAAGLAPESEQVANIINALVWLIDRGHIIEFMNGKLTVPDGMRLVANKTRK